MTKLRTYLLPIALLASMARGQPLRGQSASPESPAVMERAIALLNEARRQFQSVQDYEYRSVGRERVNGVLMPETVMRMKVRNNPFSVYLLCESPDSDRGMEVCYVEGKNQGMMRVHPAGVRGLFGFWSIDTRDARVFEKNRHSIKEAGIGNLLESTARYWDVERRLNKTVVRISDEQVGGRACTRIETLHPDRNAGDFYGYRCVLWLDKATHLPAGAETYDWPRRGGAEGGDLLESYRFLDVRCNVGLRDDVFRH